MKTNIEHIEYAKQIMKNAMQHAGCGEHPCADTYKLCEHIARKSALCVTLNPELGVTCYHGKTGTFKMDGMSFVFEAHEF